MSENPEVSSRHEVRKAEEGEVFSPSSHHETKRAEEELFSSSRYNEESESYRELGLKKMSSELPKIWLLSFPRSGNTWIRYCLEVLTQRLTFDLGRPKLPTSLPLSLQGTSSLDQDKDFVYKAHFIQEMQLEEKKHPDDRLILLLRNPREIFLRQRGSLPKEEDFTDSYKWYEITFSKYFDLISVYEKWDSEKRLLLYYEDLIENPRKELEKLLGFLKEDLNLDSFIESFEEHQKTGLKLYSFHGGSKSSIEKNYYSQQIDQQAQKEFDSLVEKYSPDLYQRYLQEHYQVL